MAGLSFGPLIEPGGIHDDLAVGGRLHVGAVHGTGRRAFKVDAFAVVTAAVARALELVFTCFPVRCAAQMCAARINHENSVWRAVYPDAVFLLPLRVYAQSVIGRIADLENGRRLEQRTRQKETQESDEPGAEKSCNGAPHQAPAAFVEFAWRGTDGGHASRGRGLGWAHSRGSYVTSSIATAASNGLGCYLRLRFGRSGYRVRHAFPPGWLVPEISWRPRNAPLVLLLVLMAVNRSLKQNKRV